MKRYIYMNERIKECKPSGPVVAVQTGETIRNTDHVQLVVDGRVVAEVRFLPEGLAIATEHWVRAYVEVSPEVELVYP